MSRSFADEKEINASAPTRYIRNSKSASAVPVRTPAASRYQSNQATTFTNMSNFKKNEDIKHMQYVQKADDQQMDAVDQFYKT